MLLFALLLAWLITFYLLTIGSFSTMTESESETQRHETEGNDNLEVPSCLESLVSSAEQLQQLAQSIGQYYIKSLLCFGYAAEPGAKLLGNAELMLNKTQNPITDGVFDHPNKRETSYAQSNSSSRHQTNILTRNNLDLAKLIKDSENLEFMNLVLNFLPFLDELSSVVERCQATIESSLKRSTYYLNKVSTKQLITTNTLVDNEFQLPPSTKLHPVFVALMDLFYAIVSLDETIRTHTTISQSLNNFKAICQLVQDGLKDTAPCNIGEFDEGLRQVPSDRLKDLIDFLGNIQLTLCNEKRTIFQQCLEHVQHLNLILSNGRSSRGFKSLCEHFEEFTVFYGENLINASSITINNDSTDAPSIVNPNKTAQEISIYLLNLNLIPNLFMTNTPIKIFGLSSLFILYSWVFKKSERKLIKSIMQAVQSSKTTNLIHLIGSNSYIKLDEFLSKHLPKTMLEMKVLRHLQQQNEFSLKLNVAQEFARFTLKVVPWLIRFKEETLKEVKSEFIEDLDSIKRQISLLQKGHELVQEINYTIKTTIAIHMHSNKSITKNNLILLLRLVSLIKSIEATVRKNQSLVFKCEFSAEQLACSKWRKLLFSIKKRLVALKYSERRLDTNTTLMIAAICSRVDYLATTNQYGRNLLSIGLSILIPSLDSNEIATLNNILIILAHGTIKRLNSSADCGYIYWNLPAFSSYYNHTIEEDPGNMEEIHYLNMALDDIPNLFTSTRDCLPNSWNVVNLSWLTDKRDEFLRRLNDELSDQFKTDFLEKICQELEIELRLQTHRDLNLDGHNPFKRHLYNFKNFFSSSKTRTTFRLMNQQISMPYYVEQYLDRVCYNLTTITPHDWFTYDNMLNLARHKYTLQFANSQLPTQTLDYGLDLLDITKNLALFVSKYGYDLTNQLFIEKSSSRLSVSSATSTYSVGAPSSLSGQVTSSNSSHNHTLHVVQTKHISKSIHMHGFGLLNSAVNCTYQVMKRLVNLISRQVSDDKLRAVLTKEYQLLDLDSGSHERQSVSMSFDRANRMAKKFRLSVTGAVPDQTNRNPTMDLDSLRQSITQLGNCLGFIRMLKSGALNCASKSADYLPELEDLSLLRLSKLARNEFPNLDIGDSLIGAAENFDQCLTDLDENFSLNTNYFSIITRLFSDLLVGSKNFKVESTSANLRGREGAGELASSNKELEADSTQGAQSYSIKNGKSETADESKRRQHLKFFFLLVPALTINYIDYIINCKERITSRSSAGRFGALISDDGFSMGTAFLLTVLKQTERFARFEWFKQVRDKIETDACQVRQKVEDSRYEESLKQTSSLTLRRLTRLRTEYDGLDYTLSSALLFFRNSMNAA